MFGLDLCTDTAGGGSFGGSNSAALGNLSDGEGGDEENEGKLGTTLSMFTSANP